MHEDQVPQGLRRRPLAVHGAALDARGAADAGDGGVPVGVERRRRAAQIGGVLGPEQRAHRVPPVELGLHVPADVDAVHHQSGDETVDHDVLHHRADEARSGQVALAELRPAQILVDVPDHVSHRRRAAGLSASVWNQASPSRFADSPSAPSTNSLSTARVSTGSRKRRRP